MIGESAMKRLGWRFFWATPRVFGKPGLYVWAFGRNLRLLPAWRPSLAEWFRFKLHGHRTWQWGSHAVMRYFIGHGGRGQMFPELVFVHLGFVSVEVRVVVISQAGRP